MPPVAPLVVPLVVLVPLFCELDDVSLLCELVVVDGVEATVVAAELLASAGSWPDASTIVISSQPAMVRRRIERARAIRICLTAWPRARAAVGSLSVMSCTSRFGFEVARLA